MKLSSSKHVFLTFLLAVAVIGFVVFLTPQSSVNRVSTNLNSTQKNNSLNTYTSKDLKIAFNYPRSWYLNEKYFDITITSFLTKIGDDKSPENDQIKIFLSIFNGCHNSIEENLIDPGCGEGGLSVPKNKITSKKVTESPGGNYLKFSLDSPDKNQQIQYFFQKGDKILQISKTPDPSQFEKEFEDIVNSIRFID